MKLYKGKCSYGEQTRDVRHKYHLTTICNPSSRLPLGSHMLSASVSAWTHEGLPAEKTPMIKSANRYSKSQISWLRD